MQNVDQDTGRALPEPSSYALNSSRLPGLRVRSASAHNVTRATLDQHTRHPLDRSPKLLRSGGAGDRGWAEARERGPVNRGARERRERSAIPWGSQGPEDRSLALERERWTTLARGSICQGTISGINRFGLFVSVLGHTPTGLVTPPHVPLSLLPLFTHAGQPCALVVRKLPH